MSAKLRKFTAKEIRESLQDMVGDEDICFFPSDPDSIRVADGNITKGFTVKVGASKFKITVEEVA